jgi:DNA-binding CsgD family transcriptional regulator
MQVTEALTLVLRAEQALIDRDWEAARAGFEAALATAKTPEGYDGLGKALWWLGDVDGAIAHRERAYALFRKGGETERAIRVALWLAREYAEAVGNEPASSGWLARAQGLVHDRLGPEYGWFAVTRGRLAVDPASAVSDAEVAVEAARLSRDPDLEASALALLGLARVAGGEVDRGMVLLDEAMVVVTGGEVEDPLVFGDVCCLVTRAIEEAGDISRLQRWNEVVMTFMMRTGHAPLLEFCGTCCAELLAANGKLEEAEGWLVRTLRDLEATGHRARCVHPAAKLAELRVLQGRLEEADRLLARFEDRPDALRATAAVHLAKGETALAAALLLRRLGQLGDGLLAIPLLALLVEVQLKQGNPFDAQATADRLDLVAARSDGIRSQATADLAVGSAAAAAGLVAVARVRLETATARFDRLGIPIEAGRARLVLASVLRPTEPELAVHEARLALDAFDQAGAVALSDQAARLLRDLGGPARTGPKAMKLLTKRELEVLLVLGEGLTNAEIASRLYISTKTAGHHVSNILVKLHLRSRTEAAALALRYSGQNPAQQ